MLTNLYVRNLALIDEAEVPFGQGLHILTGETGAGKSLLIDSISMALGQKVSRGAARDAGKPCVAELTFSVESPSLVEKLTAIGAAPEDGQLIITRKLQDGRSTCRLNGETCTAAKVREVASLLLDIHGQHEHQSLLYPDRQLDILDAYGREAIAPLTARTADAWEHWRTVCRDLEACMTDDSQREREMAFLQYEIREIEEAALIPGEDEELEQAYRRMANGKKIAEVLQSVHRLTGYDSGAGDAIGQASRELQTVTEYDGQLDELASALADADNLLNDFNRELSDYLDGFTFSDEEFYAAEQRLDVLNRMKSRYGNSIEEILRYQEKQREKLHDLEHLAERREELKKEKEKAESVLAEASRELSEQRKRCASELSEKIAASLRELNFLAAEFSIQFTQTAAYGKNGTDSIEFLISVNPGEPLRELRRVASGGELSRIMLAIKTLLSDKDETETLIFDEIDTGISGRTAQAVSEKLSRIARSRQVICITHLAQIAAMADHHYEITKAAVSDGHTRTSIHELSEGESVCELARILGGAEITDTVMESAREMKRLAEEKKRQL